jgi:hypothetical protein
MLMEAAGWKPTAADLSAAAEAYRSAGEWGINNWLRGHGIKDVSRLRARLASDPLLRSDLTPAQREQAFKGKSVEDLRSTYPETARALDARIKSEVEGAKNTLNGLIWTARLAGLDFAADHLERYLSGKGGVDIVSSEQAHRLDFVRDVERENRKRFENVTFLGKTLRNEDVNFKLHHMNPNGLPVIIEDKWDRASDSILEHPFNPDAGLTFGRAQVTSYFIGEARREGDKIYITGNVTHTLTDTYDFQRGKIEAEAPLVMRQDGDAQDYDIKGSWSQPVSGTVLVERVGDEDVLSDPKFQWGGFHDVPPGQPIDKPHSLK